jgi:pimeloyl-ACP methyl ester carboxylesterase
MANEIPFGDGPARSAAIFVHGLFSSGDTWTPLVNLLEQDPFVGRAFQLERFAYSSPKLELRPWRRIPTFRDIAETFRVWLKANIQVKAADKLVFVGHSQGGLIIQQYMSTVLADGKIDELRKVRAVILLATPNTGSELFFSLRRRLEWIWYHPQERQLRPYDEEIERTRRVVLERAVLAPVPSGRMYPIRFFVYAGESDRVVPARSAQWMFPDAGVLPGDHSSILMPRDARDLRFTALRSALSWVRRSFPPDGVLIQTEAVNLASTKDLEDLNALATELFHPSQTMRPNDFRHWLENYREDWKLRLSVLVAKVNESIMGFLMFHESSEIILVDYIAARNAGHIGALGGEPMSNVLVGRMVAQLRTRATQLGGVPIVFEVEDPNTADNPRVARARVKYFEQLGACPIFGLNYLAPDMTTMKLGDEMPHILMYARPGEMPKRLTAVRVRTILEFIYLVWYRNWFSNRENADQHEAYLQTLFERAVSTLQQEYVLGGGPAKPSHVAATNDVSTK